MSRLKAIINLEGIDGTGKNTVSQKLKELLEAKGLSVFNLHFPQYSSPTGKVVKAFLKGELVGDPTAIDPILSSLYYTTDRLTYFKNRPEIFEKYDVLIFDRSYMSNFFFQTPKYLDSDFYTKDLADYINIMHNLEIMNTPLSDHQDKISTFMLYHPNVDTNFKLMKERNEESDLHESNKMYLKTVQEHALHKLYKPGKVIKVYDFIPIACSDSDGNLRNIDSISEDIIQHTGIC